MTTWIEVSSLPDGTYPATLISALSTVTTGGNKAVSFQFNVNGRPLNMVQQLTGPYAVSLYDTALALGANPKQLRLSELAGRKCRVVVKNRGPYVNITNVLPA